jgi:hypothetical protein
MAHDGEAPPNLASIFDAQGTSLADMITICTSKTYPYAITEAAAESHPDWSEDERADALNLQCDEMIPKLLTQQSAERAAEKKRKAEEEKAAKEAEAKKRREEAAKEAAAKEIIRKKEEEIRKKKAEEAAKKAAEEKAKKDAEAKKKAEEDKIKKEEAARQKAIDDKKKAEEKAIKDAEDKIKREEAAKKKAEDDKKKAEEKAIKDAEDKIKKEEAAKKKAEDDKIKAEQKAIDDKKKAEEKAKKDAEDKIKREEKAIQDKKKAEEKAIADKKRAEEKAIADEKKKIDDAKRREEDKKKAEQRALEKEAADKKKEAEDKRKAAAAAAEKARREEENRAKEEERAAAKAAKEEERKAKEEEKAAAKAAKEEEKRKKAEEAAAAGQENDEGVEWDEETGQMIRKKVKINDRNMTMDPGCGCGPSMAKCCQVFSFLVIFLLMPAVYGGLVYAEYAAHGWERIVARAGYTPFEMNLQPTPSPVMNKHLHPTLPPKTRGEALEEFLKTHPLSWILPCMGVGLGLFGNIVCITPNIILMPLLQQMEICHTADSTFAFAIAIQAVNNGLFGFFTWCSRDARFFICRALWLLPPVGWMGYLVGVTNHLSFKDILWRVYRNNEDEHMKEEFDKADIKLLHTYIRIGFGCFMVFMSLFVAIGLCIGGMNRYCCPSYSGGSTPGCKSFCQWIIVLTLTFHTGYMFVANIGCGMGITTFFLLSMFLGVETKRAMPTAIVISGWTAIAPMAVNLYYLVDETGKSTFPYIRLMMIVPGFWFGSILAPWFSKCGGPICDLVLFFFVLIGVGTLTVAFAAKSMQDMNEDVDIDIRPLISIPAIDEYFDEEAKKRSSSHGGGDGGEGEVKHKALGEAAVAAAVAEAAVRYLRSRL